MKAGSKAQGKGRGPQQGGCLRHLKMPPLKKTPPLKFKAKPTKKESMVNASALRRTSDTRSPTKHSSSSSCSESSPKSSSGVSSRSRSSNSSSLSPSRAPSRVTGRSPARRSTGRSPTRGPDSAKINRKGIKATHKDAGSSKHSKTAENACNPKSKAVPEKKQEMTKSKKTAFSDSNKSVSQSAKQLLVEKGKKSLFKCRRPSESNAKSSDEKEESDKDAKKKTKKTKDIYVEKQEGDKDTKKKKKSEEKREESDKVSKNKSRVCDEKNESETDNKRKSKKFFESRVCESPGKVKERKMKEEKVSEGQTKEEVEDYIKVREEHDKNSKNVDCVKSTSIKYDRNTNVKTDIDEVDKKSEEDDKCLEKKKPRKTWLEKEDEENGGIRCKKAKETKSEGKKTSDIGDTSVSKSVEKEKLSPKDGKVATSGKRDKMVKSDAKAVSEDCNSITSKPKKKSAVKKTAGGNEGENVHFKEEKKTVSTKKDNPTYSDAKDTKNKSVSSSQEMLMPKRRGRPKGSKNKRKNDGLPTTRIKKDKQKVESKHNAIKFTNTKGKKERSVFSFSESEGERDERLAKGKKGTKTKLKIKEEKEPVEEEENSSTESSSSDEDSQNSFKGISKAKLYGGRTDCPKKVVIGGKVYKLKRDSPKSRLNSKKASHKLPQNKKVKKHLTSVFYSEEESEGDKKISKIAKVRSDDSESSDLEVIQKSKKTADCLNEETSYEDISDDDEDWGSRKKLKKQIKNSRPRKGIRSMKSKISDRMSEKSDDDKDETEEEEDIDYKSSKPNRRQGNSKTSVKSKISNANQKRPKQGPPTHSLKSESSEEENDEDDQEEVKKAHKKLSYKNSNRTHKKSSKEVSPLGGKKSKKVTFLKKGNRGKDDSSDDDESDKESDSDYEAHTRKKTEKGILKTKKHLKNNKRNMNAAPPRRTARMAFLNARAMMHCMNEDARIPLPSLPASSAKNDNMALILRDQVIHDSQSEESDEEDRDYDSDDDKRGKRRKNIKRKNEEETEKKVKMKRKRRRGELDVHMDMRDMVVTKRMASLNASAIMAASYSNESRKRTPTATTSSSAESEITNVDIKRKISVKSTKERNTTTSSVITVEETTKKVKKAQGSRETEVEERIIVKKKVKRQGGTDSDREDGNATDNSELASDILTRRQEEPKSLMEESSCTYITTQIPSAPQTVTISGESTYCITSSDGKTTTMVKQVQRKTTTTGGSTTSAPPTACIPPTHHVQPQPQPQSTSYPLASQKPDSYSPLGALSTMQPVMSPGGTHHHHHHHHHQPHPPHHQPPPPHHPPHLPPPHHQPPHHHPPTHHPSSHPPPHNYPQSHHHHPHHQPYPPPPSSHSHPTLPPPGHHCSYRPPPQTPPSGNNSAAGGSCLGNHVPPVVGAPIVGSYPSHSSPGYVAPGHTVSPGHSTHPPHHSPKQMASPSHVSPNVKSPQGGSGGPHTPTGSPRAATLQAGQVERHHSAFTAPAPSTHSPAASTPAGYQPVSGPMPVKPNYTATTSDGSGPYKAPKGSPVAAAPPYSSPPRLTSPPLPIKAPPSQSGSEPYSPPYQYHTYSYHPAPAPPPPPPASHVAPYDKYYPRGATYHLYPPAYSGGQYPPAVSSAEYSYPPPPSGGMHYSQESYTSYTLCVPNAPPQGPPQALALPPPPPTSNGPHPPAYATYHYTEYTPVFAYPPTGPSSQSTICCPVDPKNVHTWPPTGNGRGSEASSNSNQCSGLGQGGGGGSGVGSSGGGGRSGGGCGSNSGGSGGAGYQYSYRPSLPPQPSPSETPQGCSTPSVYQTGPLTTVMTTGTQPTIQVFGAVVPQQTVTLIPSQESQTVNTHPPSVPPPVPAPVPPVVPLSQPQLTTATTMVAMAPISVTVPLNPGSSHASQASTVPAQASTTASGISECSVPAHQNVSAYGSVTMSQLATANSSASTITCEASMPTSLLSQPFSAASPEVSTCTTAVVTGVPQTTVNLSPPLNTDMTGRTHPVLSPPDQTSILAKTVLTPQIAASSTSQVSLPVMSPTHTTATVNPSKPQSLVAPTQVTAGAMTGVPHHTATSTQGTIAIITGIPQTSVVTTNVTAAVVTGVPQSSATPVAVSTYQSLPPPSECTKAVEIKPTQCAPLPLRATTTHASRNYHKVTQTLSNNKAISCLPQAVESIAETSTTESQLQEQITRPDASTLGTTTNGTKPHLVNTQSTISTVSGAQKTPVISPQLSHAVATSSQESQLISTKVIMAVVTGVPKPSLTSPHINTAVVSGVPRVSTGFICTPPSATTISAPANHMKDAARNPFNDISKNSLPTIQSSQDNQEKVNHSLSPSSEICSNPAVLHKVSSNHGLQHFSKTTNKVSNGKSVSHNTKDTIDLTVIEPQVTKPRRALEAHGNSHKDGMQNTCSVPPMDESGVIIRDCVPAKKRKLISVPEEVTELPTSATSIPGTSPSPSTGCLSSRNWSPTQSGVTSAVVVSCASSNVTEVPTTLSMDDVCINKVQGLSISEVKANSNSLSVAATSISSSLGNIQSPNLIHSKTSNSSNTLVDVRSSTPPPSASQGGGTTFVVREIQNLNIHTEVPQNKDTEGTKGAANTSTLQQGYQRTGTRHLLCQTLPTLTTAKAVTAPLAKPKSSTSSVPKLLVKLEEKSKDLKPNIMGNVPTSQTNSVSFELSPNIVTNNISGKEESESDFLDVKTGLAPIVRKRGRPPKTRDASSDSSTSEASNTSSVVTFSPKTKTSHSPLKPIQSLDEKESQKCKSADENSHGSKMLRSHAEERKKEVLQSSNSTSSPSKQTMDCKPDIKLAGSVKIKTEALPKIKTEKVSPRGSTKMPSLKMCPKDISHFKTKLMESPSEVPLKSGFIPKKLDLPSSSKAVGLADNIKTTKTLRDVKKSTMGLLSDQRVPKNSLIASKSKSKEVPDKKILTSNNSGKRRGGESVGVSGKGATSSSTKTSVAESANRTTATGKNPTSKLHKAAKSNKTTSRRSPPNGRLNRKKSLLSYLKEDINESDTSSVDSEVVSGRKRSRSKEDPPKSNSASLFCPSLPINAGSRRRSAVMQGKGKAAKKPRWVHNWSWEGEPFEGKIWLRNDELELDRTCYRAMRHKEGDIVRVRDCVLLRSGTRRTDLPYVAKIASLWEDPETSDMMMSILWYYRPEHTESGRRPDDLPDEIFASKHRDHLSVACIEDRCYVLTFNEYCRYRRLVRFFQEGVYPMATPVPDPEEGYCRKDRLPPGCVVPDLLFFCRRVYDYRIKRLLKNPY